MLSRSILRYSLVALISAASATLSVATAVSAHNDGFNERIVACFDSRDPNSDECNAALEVSPVGADFFTALAGNLAARPAQPEPQPEPKQDLWSLMKACLETKDLSSDACQQALDASGLSPEDFKAKLEAKFGCVSALTHDGGDPCTHKTAGDVSGSFKDCLALRATMHGLSATELAAKTEKLQSVCHKAMTESRMSAGEFWRHH
jgi:hypothetical protein